MSVSVSVASAIEKNKVYSGVAWIVMVEAEIKHPETGEILDTLRFCQNNEPITWKGNEYIAADFDLAAEMKEGQMPRVTVSARDTSGMLRDQLEEYDGIVGSDVIISVLNTDNMDGVPEIRERFTVISSSSTGFDSTIELGVENPLALRFPRRRHFSDRCTKKFKGVTCQYAGTDTTCTYTLDDPGGCKSKGNEINFGGFKGMRATNR